MPRLTLCFDAHRQDGHVWAVRIGRRWHSATAVSLHGVTFETVYKGPTARQPRAYLTGEGIVHWPMKGHAMILPDVPVKPLSLQRRPARRNF